MVDAQNKSSMVQKWGKVILTVAVAVIISLIPPPTGLTVYSMRYIGILAGMIVGLFIKSAPDYILLVAAILAMSMTGVMTFSEAFSAFSGTTVWLLIPAFAMSAVFLKTGILARIALHILSWFPARYKTQIWANTVANVIISPLIPSNQAKGALMAPFAASIAEELKFPKNSNGSAGIFCSMYVPTNGAGCAWFTGSVLCTMVMSYLGDSVGNMSWLRWLSYTFVYYIVTVVISTILCLKIYPEKNYTSNSEGGKETHFARKRLQELGPMTADEKKCAFVLIFAMMFWIFGESIGVSAAATGCIAMILLALLGPLTSSDFRTKVSWETIIFVGGLSGIGNGMSMTGINTWLADKLSPYIGWMFANPYIFTICLCAFFFIIRFFIMSQAVMLAIAFGMFASVCSNFGYSPWIPMFIVICIQQVWSLSFTNTTTIATLACTGGNMLDYPKIQKFSYAFFIASVLGMLAQVPMWQVMNLC